MSILEIVFHLIELIAAGTSALIFVRARRNTILTGLGALALIEAVLLGLFPDRNVEMFLFWILVALLTVFFILFEKRKLGDGWIVFCTCVSIKEIYIIFCNGFHFYQNENVSFWLVNSVFSLMLATIFLGFRKFSLPEQWETNFQLNKDQKKSEQSEIQPWFVYIISGSLAFLMAVIFPLVPDTTKSQFIAKLVLAAMIFGGCIVFMLLLIVYCSEKARYSVEYTYRDEMKSFMNVVRSQRHDYNLHVQTVASLIQQKKWDECREYVDALVQDTAAMNTILPIKDPAIAALINNYKNMAAQKNISMTIDIRDDLSHVTTSVYETNKVIGNLLQNAIDEVEHSEDKSGGIQLNIFKRGEFCLVRVSNRVKDIEQFQKYQDVLFDQGYTTKKGHDGVGLSSLRLLLSKVDGDIFSWLEGDTVHFIASIPVNYLRNER